MCCKARTIAELSSSCAFHHFDTISWLLNERLGFIFALLQHKTREFLRLSMFREREENFFEKSS